MNISQARKIVDAADNAIAAHILAEDANGNCVQMLHDGRLSLWIFPDQSVLRINGLRIWGYVDMETCQECLMQEMEQLNLSRPDSPEVY